MRAGTYVAVGYNSGGTETVEFAGRNGTNSYTVLAVPFSRTAPSPSRATSSCSPSNPNTDTDRDGVVDNV